MSVFIKNGNMLNSEDKYLCQVCNTQGIWGAGIAPQIGKKWPEVHNQHIDFCLLHDKNWQRMKGRSQISISNDYKYIVNMMAMPTRQLNNGTMEVFRSFCHQSFAICLNELDDFIRNNSNASQCISMPYGIGSKLAGGNIDIVNQLILDWSIHTNHKVTLWVFNENEWSDSIKKWKPLFQK